MARSSTHTDLDDPNLFEHRSRVMPNIETPSDPMDGTDLARADRESKDDTVIMREKTMTHMNARSSSPNRGFLSKFKARIANFFIPSSNYSVDDNLDNKSLEHSTHYVISEVSSENQLQSALSSLGLTQIQIDFVVNQGEKFLDKPLILSLKFDISDETAIRALAALKSYKQETFGQIPQAVITTIDNCVKEHPKLDIEEVSLICGIEETIVSTYFDRIPLTEAQKAAITEKFNVGCDVAVIVRMLKLSKKKVHDYVEATFLTFTSEEGREILKIIQSNFGEIESTKLREMVVSRNLKLQNRLCCILFRRDLNQYTAIARYFGKYEESKKFFNIEKKVTLADILEIKKYSSESIEQLSLRINKVETVIHDYLIRYCPNSIERDYYANTQVNSIRNIASMFGEDTLSFYSYRMIISESFENIIDNAKRIGHDPRAVFRELLPLSFYYLKCSLPLEDITEIITNSCDIILTTHDLFHIMFQLSDPVLSGFCIEHYSFSNPVPLYYPVLQTYSNESESKFEICKELWYSMQPFNGLISFGLGRAGWNPIGKSHLLDLIFGTDFEKGNPPNSAFHFNSIDIQMTKNLFGEINDKSNIEFTKWSFIDCHSHCNLEIIRNLCQHLDIALVNISYSDFTIHKDLFNQEINSFMKSVTYLYILIRDCNGDEVRIKNEGNKDSFVEYIYIPNLTHNRKIHSLTISLKEVGYKILKTNCLKLVGSNFLESVLTYFNDPCLANIQAEQSLVHKITTYIEKLVQCSGEIDFSFLNYYSLYMEYMSCYYRLCYETDQKTIDELNVQYGTLAEKLSNTQMGDVVLHFNEILKRENSTLILLKLSQKLNFISKRLLSQKDTAIEHKNDRYTLEIIWREALLSIKYGKQNKTDINNYQQTFASNFSRHVERGETFELIDGDNLRFFNKDIDDLLYNFYERQLADLQKINKGQRLQMKQAPIVVSIFGPQSSGKSTLLNYCFGCKFLTSAGRCTRGVYGSLSKLSRPINLTNHLLILDTEGLDAIERGNIQDTSRIHFDRTMVLFCLAVSQVVIINVRGDIGSEMQNLLQICAYSLNTLKVRKVAAPKIFFVLNQQADPDPTKHLDSMNILMDKLNKETYLLNTEGIKISDLIEVSRDNLFILPSAFNAERMNKPGSKLFDFNVTKLSPTITFADKCSELRLAIIQQLDCMPIGDRATFSTMSDWMDMSGTIWDTIIKYQDIVKYRNAEELQCSNILGSIVSELMNKNIYSHKEKFQLVTEKLLNEISTIDVLHPPNILLAEFMIKFDEVYNKYQDECLNQFNTKCQNHTLLRLMSHLCDERKFNLSRLIYIERKSHEDKLKFQIRTVLTEIKLSECMKMFQEAIIKNVDNFLELNIEEQKMAFEKIWAQCFGDDDPKEEINERDDNFNDLYSIFKMELRSFENRSAVYQLFRDFNFRMDGVVSSIHGSLLAKFCTNQFIYSFNGNNTPIKEMTPYLGRSTYEYFGKQSLFSQNKWKKSQISISSWIPEECRPLVQYCSGYFNHPDIIWNKLDKNSQILRLSSQLKDPSTSKISTWNKFVNNISSNVRLYTERDPNISQGTVKEIVNYLYSEYKLVNYEIGFIEARLSDAAERAISTFVFAYAFKSFWEAKLKTRLETKLKKEVKKSSLLQYFLQKIEIRKMVRGEMDSGKMKESDQKFSKQFAQDFLEAIQRSVNIEQQLIIESNLKTHKILLSHGSLYQSAEDLITNQLNKSESESDSEKLVDFVVQFICNRNELIKELFHNKWSGIEEELYSSINAEMNFRFGEQVEKLRNILEKLLKRLVKKSTEFKSFKEAAFDSDSNFELAKMKNASEDSDEKDIKGRECPFKAMVTYLRMYLDPKVSCAEFNNFFKNKFELDDVEVKRSDTYNLCEKVFDPTDVLDEDIFKKLSNTTMFNSENIFNIHVYITSFLSALAEYKYELTKNKFAQMLKPIKEEFETNVIGCPSQCPSCGKLCERELHPNDGICQIKSGHQICSMGGKVWNNDRERNAVLVMCDDYWDSTRVLIGGVSMSWGEFKDKCGNDWDLTLPKTENYLERQRANRERMQNIWNKFGRAILQHYLDTNGTKVNFIHYNSVEEVYRTQFSVKYNVCFVIDGTSSMYTDIKRARISVGQFISKYKEMGTESKFKVIIYRDHCDKKVIEVFPNDNQFTDQHESIEQFLKGVKAYGGGDYPEAVLDGLATAFAKCEWQMEIGTKNVIIHIYDAPPHGNFPNYIAHHPKSNKKHCCCCNYDKLCPFDWEKDVWSNIRKYQVHYNGINTGNNLPEFEKVMKSKLEELCGDFQTVGKEVVNDAILQIFIDYETN